MTTNARRKGKRAESLVVKMLNERFKHLPIESGRFSRTVGSGNRFEQGVVLSMAARHCYCADITAPDGFRWSLESKSGYRDIAISSMLDGKRLAFDRLLEQAVKDAERTNRKPALVFRQNNKPPLVFVRYGELPKDLKFYFRYDDWEAITFKDWLKIPDDSYFFDGLKLN